MVKVKSLNARLEILVILQSTIQPVDTANGIRLVAKVDECLTG